MKGFDNKYMDILEKILLLEGRITGEISDENDVDILDVQELLKECYDEIFMLRRLVDADSDYDYRNLTKSNISYEF